jgi:hypothetical protein
MRQTREKVHSTYLFPSIVLLLIAQPVFATLYASESDLLALPVAATLAAVGWSLDATGRWFRVCLWLGLAAIAMTAAHELIPDPTLVIATTVCLIALGVLCICLGIRVLFRSPEVTVENLLTAMSVYLLIGVSFGLTFELMYRIDPAWLHGVSPGGRAATTAALLYFSIGTLTTAAYGDIAPVHPIARLLANVESVMGQMYLAVLVARLVSGYAPRRSH